MTPDESAWWEAFLTVLPDVGTSHGMGVEDEAARSADRAVAELQKRREAGAFGPAKAHCSDPDCNATETFTVYGPAGVVSATTPAVVCPKCERPAPLDLPHLCAPPFCVERVTSSDFPAPCGRELPCSVHGEAAVIRSLESKWLQATMRAKTAERERDVARQGLDTQTQRAFAAERERDGASAELLSMTESRDAIQAERDEQRARAEAAEMDVRNISGTNNQPRKDRRPGGRMSRGVEVLRGLLDHAQEKADFARRQDWPERAAKYDRQVAALTAAIAALEAPSYIPPSEVDHEE